MAKKIYVLIFLYALLFVVFAIYSYTQIDLNLTLSSNPFYQSIQNQLIHIGYYNRPLSTGYFVAIVLSFFVLYMTTLILVGQKYIASKHVFIIIGLSVVLGVISYTAFSHDFFNYLFDARIFVHYGQNPYIHKALDFPDDLWLRFMRWTHRTYPYGPLWIVLTIPVYAVGFGKFILTELLFKLLFATTYILNGYFIYHIAQKIDPKKALLSLVFFALNPLVVIESLISPHLDSMMLSFLLLGIFFYQKQKNGWWFLGFLASAGIKFVTATIIPVFLILKKLPLQQRITYAAWIFVGTLAVPIYLREAYPWYMIPFIGLAALSKSVVLRISAIAISISLLFRYTTFLYTGTYTEATAYAQNVLTISLFFTIFLLLWFLEKKKWVHVV